MMHTNSAKYYLGQIVRHKKHPFRGVVFDVDPEFNNTEEWYQSIRKTTIEPNSPTTIC